MDTSTVIVSVRKLLPKYRRDLTQPRLFDTGDRISDTKEASRDRCNICATTQPGTHDRRFFKFSDRPSLDRLHCDVIIRSQLGGIAHRVAQGDSERTALITGCDGTGIAPSAIVP